MAIWLRQGGGAISTTQTILVGPFIDDTDGKTAEVALTLTSGDFLLWKEGGTTLAAKSHTSSGTHRSLGYYTTTLDATDLDTLGVLIVAVHEAGALPVKQVYEVIPAEIYDAYVGTARQKVDVVKVNGTASYAANLAMSLSVIQQGTTTNTPNAASTTVFECNDIVEPTADHYIGRVVVFTSGVMKYQAGAISDYALSGSNGVFTMSSALTEAPPAGTTFVIV